MNSWITTATFRNAQDCVVLKAKLESAGIPVHIRDEHASLYLRRVNAKLQVRTPDVRRACGMLGVPVPISKPEDALSTLGLVFHRFFRGIPKAEPEKPRRRVRPRTLAFILLGVAVVLWVVLG